MGRRQALRESGVRVRADPGVSWVKFKPSFLGVRPCFLQPSASPRAVTLTFIPPQGRQPPADTERKESLKDTGSPHLAGGPAGDRAGSGLSEPRSPQGQKDLNNKKIKRLERH